MVENFAFVDFCELLTISADILNFLKNCEREGIGEVGNRGVRGVKVVRGEQTECKEIKEFREFRELRKPIAKLLKFTKFPKLPITLTTLSMRPLLERVVKNQRQRLTPENPVVLAIANTELDRHLFALHFDKEIDVCRDDSVVVATVHHPAHRA